MSLLRSATRADTGDTAHRAISAALMRIVKGGEALQMKVVSKRHEQTKPADNHRDFERRRFRSDADLMTCMPRPKKTTLILLVFAPWMFHISFAFAKSGDQNAQATTSSNRIARGDIPLNLLEVEGGGLSARTPDGITPISKSTTNNSARSRASWIFPAPSTGWPTMPIRKLLLASSADSSVFVSEVAIPSLQIGH